MSYPTGKRVDFASFVDVRVIKSKRMGRIPVMTEYTVLDSAV